jgi:PAS domain S-box-containing protein
MNRLPASVSSLDILAQLPDPVIAIDLQGLVLFWNEAAERLYGWTAEEAIGASANDLLKTRSNQPLEPIIDSLLRDGRWEGELTRIRRTGEPVDVLSRCSLLRDAAGAAVARVLIDTDLTEARLHFHELRLAEAEARTQAQEAEKREALLSCLIDGISDFAYMKDPAGRYIAVNNATATFFGKTPSEIVGKTDAALFPPAIAARLAEEDRIVLETQQSKACEQELPSQGGVVLVHTIKTVCRDRTGQVIGLVGISRDMTERKQLEDMLRERERDLIEAHRIAKLGTWSWLRDPDTVIWSDEVYRILGHDRNRRPFSYRELLSQVSPSETWPPLLAALDRAVRFGEPYAMDVEIPADDGTMRWIAAGAEVESWENGQVAKLRGTVQDITERKRMELALRERERQLLELHRLSGIGTWRWVRATDTVTWSDEIYRIYGLDKSFKPWNYAEFSSRPQINDSDGLFLKAFQRLEKYGEPYTMDIEIPQADGSTRWVVARGEVESWENGEVASVRGTVTEITERKRHEEQLALSENRYRSLVRASTQIVWITNTLGQQMRSIPEWQAFTGQSTAEVQGIGWADAIHPEDRERTVALWQECIASGNTFEMEHRLHRHDGAYRTMAACAVPVRNEAGVIVEWVGTHTDITDKKQAEEEARIAHERLQNVLDSITDGLCVLDRDWQYTYYNENGARLSGLRSADIVGKRLGDLFPNNKTSAIGRAYRRAVETGEPVHVEDFYGEPLNRWFECHCYPSSQGLTVYFRDVTERKRTDEALRASESRFRKLFESNLLGICMPDRFGAFKEGNNELLRMTGYSREDLEAGLVRWDRMTPPEYADLDAQHIAEAAEHGSCTPYEKEYIRKDGTRVPILCGYALLEDSEDEYIGFVLDISRQRRAEAALREREQRFRLLAEGIPQLVWLTDPYGTILYLNARFLEYIGLPAEAMSGFNWTTILHPDESEHVLDEWSRSVESGEPYLIELRLRREDGSFRFFLARGLPMRNDAGQIQRWIGSCTDVHDQRLSEEALRRSEKLAATGRLAASIAHEINNPLAAVTNSLYLALLDEKLSADTRNFLKTAEQELARVAHITTQTLRFHKQSKSAAIADLSDTMASVLTLFGPRLMARKIEVQRECEPGSSINCFDDELRQVFANLVSNSLDATPEGGRLRIRVRNVQATGEPGVRVTVADTGCGIPTKVRKRIFEPFFSTKDTTGIGLGLWVSDGIIRKHRGRLSLRSSTEPNRRGTVISIFFPREC